MNRWHRALWTMGAVWVGGIVAASDRTAIGATAFLAHVKYLASDELEGRGNGTTGLEKAAHYIAEHFRADRLEPGGDGGSFFQPFDLDTSITVEDGNALNLHVGSHTESARIGVDYFPMSLTNSTTRTPERLALVFAGYGISAPALGYDDYAGLDVAGKAVLIFTHEPQEDDASSVFEGKANTLHATVFQKVSAARSHGVRLLLLIQDPTHGEDTNIFERWLKDPQAEEYGIETARVNRSLAERLLSGSIDLPGTARAIDGDLRPRSQAVHDAEVVYGEHLVKVRRTVRNVIAVLPGADPVRRHEAIVIGAHYDHLGLGGRSSLVDNPYGIIHNGADDNASGTAGLLEIARAASRSRRLFPRTLVFVAFAGEELGLLGSARYVDHPSVPLDQTVAMINLDMIGRPAGRILLSGLDTAPSLQADVDASNDGGLEIRMFKEGSNVGSSDDTSFVLRRIPSIGFFSGFHEDYHKPSDDWQKIDAEGGASVARLALALATRLANRNDRPAFVEPQTQGHGSAAAGSVSGYGPYFGSVPDFAGDQDGVRFADVRANSPAALAGFRRGDVLVEFDGTPIKTLYDFTFALRQKRPGDRVQVVVRRDGQDVRAEVELGRRN